MTGQPVEFSDDDGRDWSLEILWAHPAPAELGIRAARFRPVDGDDAEVRVGYVEERWLVEMDLEMLREALRESEPGEAL